MENTPGKKKKASDTDKAIARPGLESKSTISQDTFVAEKDEVKIAEERLREKKSKTTSDGKM
jgi:hypothetical protein